MKRLTLAALAALMFAAPLTISTSAAAHEGRGRHERGWDDDDRHYRGSRANWQHEEWRRERAHERWDARRYNGYWYGDRWYYGPPPSHWRDDARYGYRSWRRGEYLPDYYRSYYRPVDWRSHHLRPPPRGYHYVYDRDREEYLLIGIATGAILGIILAN